MARAGGAQRPDPLRGPPGVPAAARTLRRHLQVQEASSPSIAGSAQVREHHQVEIYLHNQYPQRWPGLKWLTPIWHPNINHLNGSVCIDAAWWTASRSLDRLVIMLGEMVQYKNFHDDPTQPPFPWDAGGRPLVPRVPHAPPGGLPGRLRRNCCGRSASSSPVSQPARKAVRVR